VPSHHPFVHRGTGNEREKDVETTSQPNERDGMRSADAVRLTGCSVPVASESQQFGHGLSLDSIDSSDQVDLIASVLLLRAN
jgi:hypothetical protein